MNTLPVPVQRPQSGSQPSTWRSRGPWIAFAAAALLAAAISFFGWGGVAKAFPYALILACPAMHLLMCRKHKSPPAGDDAAPR